jgi:hypothetical protein
MDILNFSETDNTLIPKIIHYFNNTTLDIISVIKEVFVDEEEINSIIESIMLRIYTNNYEYYIDIDILTGHYNIYPLGGIDENIPVIITLSTADIRYKFSFDRYRIYGILYKKLSDIIKNKNKYKDVQIDIDLLNPINPIDDWCSTSIQINKI